MYTVSGDEVTSAVREGYTFEKEMGRIAPDIASVTDAGCTELRLLRRFWASSGSGQCIWHAMLPEILKIDCYNFASDHFYTIHPEQADEAMQKSYVEEDPPGFCVPQRPGCGALLPLHRLWNVAVGGK